MASPALISDTDQWKALQAHVGAIHKTHLRDLMADADRCRAMTAEFEGIHLDYSRQQATAETVDKLFKLAEAAKLKEKIDKMFSGDKINSTENRSVLHVALRAPRDAVINSDGVNVVPEVWAVIDKIKQFSETFRNGSWVGATGKPLTNVVSVGIGGSFLGPLFVHTALQTDPAAAESAKGRQLRFLANVDPVDVARSIKDLDPATTLVVVVSKTFTTAETMLNARTIKEWIVSSLGPQAVSKHMIAVSTNLKLVKEFGIDPNNAFAFWDWVGGRYSVCSAVGVLPLSLQYGFPIVQKFLEGASSIDNHFRTSSFEKNIPVLLGLLSVWNVSFLGYPARAILPYSQALEKLAPHIQQLSMESNGKGVSIDGVRLPYEAGEIDFGEPGTNGQHSFYQLIHQGRVIPCDFIGVIKSQQPVYLKGETVSNHDELMSNFFAQPDALAYGKTPEQLRSENVSENLIPHKTFQGNRPSLSFLLSSLSAYEIGQLLSIYEHRIAVQGFVWGINSFDQWGVELGKSLASQVRKQLHASRMEGKPVEGFNPSSASLLARYLAVEPSTPYDTTVLPKVEHNIDITVVEEKANNLDITKVEGKAMKNKSEEASQEAGSDNPIVSQDSGQSIKKVYVGGIPYYSSEDDIRSFFEGCGSITALDCMTFPESGKFRGIAILTFKTDGAAQRALALDGADMGGFFLKVQPYKANREKVKSNHEKEDFAPKMIEGYNRMYVGNLAWDITEDDLRKFFSDCKISSIRFGTDKETGDFKGFVHVDFSDSTSLAVAMRLDQNVIKGRPVRIRCAVPKKETQKSDDNANSNSSKNKIRTCYECGTPGHLSFACPNKKASEVESSEHKANVDSAEASSKKRRTCYECGVPGHLSSACPNKKASESEAIGDENKANIGTATTSSKKRRTCYECGVPGHLSSACPNKSAAEVVSNRQTFDEPKTAPSMAYEQNKIGDGSNSAPSKRRKCYECGISGHLSSACPNKKAAETNFDEAKSVGDSSTVPATTSGEKKPSDDTSSAPRKKKKRRTCYECGIAGHLSSECPNKAAA